ncbi:MAG: MHYT domain-containing protein [Nevskia sp.]|nr:MHYT domain-containing protein [Nevskia sp.]
MSGSYDLTLMSVSYWVMVAAAYGALDLSARSVVFGRQRRRLWLWINALAGGTGIWASHLIWIVASRSPAQPTFDPALNALSWGAAVAAALLGLYIIQMRQLDGAAVAAGGAAIGVCLCVLHYAGMFALRMSPQIAYDSELFSTSVFVAMAASAASLLGGFAVQNSRTGRKPLTKLAAALLIAAAVCGVYHTATVAAHIAADAVCAPGNLLQGEAMVVPMAAVAVAAMALSLSLSILDARAATQHRRAAMERHKTLFGNSVAGG